MVPLSELYYKRVFLVMQAIFLEKIKILSYTFFQVTYLDFCLFTIHTIDHEKAEKTKQKEFHPDVA